MLYNITTYGCQRNNSDSERIASLLEKIGYTPTPRPREADLFVINACSVRQSAIDRIWGKTKIISDLKAQNPNFRALLTGCVLKKDKQKFAKIFDIVLDVKNLLKLPNLLGYNSPGTSGNYLQISPKYQSDFRAYIPIMTGCNNFCSYCAVPYTRGRETSRGAKEIICEIKNLINQEYKEIWLLGENVNSYKDGAIDFPKLLRMTNNIPGDFWLRFTSPHPKDFSSELINAIADCEKITEYINLPVQSGDDLILKKMKRPYTVKSYKDLIKKIRKKIPEITLSTDVIVGFPDETKKQFENTVKLFKELKFDMAYISQYSPRAGTIAANMQDNVSHSEKEKRDKILTKVLAKTALNNNKKYIGKITDVLIEERKNQFLIGKSRKYKTIKFESPKNLIGQFVNIQITTALPWGLFGKLKK